MISIPCGSKRDGILLFVISCIVQQFEQDDLLSYLFMSNHRHLRVPQQLFDVYKDDEKAASGFISSPFPPLASEGEVLHLSSPIDTKVSSLSSCTSIPDAKCVHSGAGRTKYMTPIACCMPTQNDLSGL